MTNEKEVMTALDTVIHPSYGMSLVALQMIRSVAVNDQGVQVEMVMNCPGCAAGKVTMGHAHRVLRPLLGSKQEEVTIVLRPEVWQAPWGFGAV